MEAGKSYHLYTHANGFENLFQSDENYRYFLRRYEHFIPSVADTLAYCLMPNHIHFLIRVKTEAELTSTFSNLRGFKNLEGLIVEEIEKELEKRISQQFGNLFNSYTKAFNKMYNRKGSLFIPNFKREEITSDNYFTNIIHYIHANPVHHGFVKNISDWPWSSYQWLSTGEPATLIDTTSVWNWFGSREEFIRFHQQPVRLKNGVSDFLQEQ